MTPEQERIDKIKQLWQEYRWTIIGGVAIGVGTIGGWTGWQEYSRIQQESASAFFQDVAVAVVEGDAQGAEDATQQLLDEHSGTSYLANAQLLLARSRFERGDIAGARDLLLQALNSAREKSTQHVARIRLAQLMLSQREFTETLELLNLSEMDGLDSHYHELRGDAYRGLNQIDKAREEYETSLESLSLASQYAGILRAKLNDTIIQN